MGIAKYFGYAIVVIFIAIFAFPLVLQLPFYLIMASPWLLVTWPLLVVTRGRLSPRSRLILLSGIAAAGLAPFFGSHMAMFPMYSFLIMEFRYRMPAFEIMPALVSIGITWGVLILIGSRRQASRNLTRSNPPGSQEAPPAGGAQ